MVLMASAYNRVIPMDRDRSVILNGCTRAVDILDQEVLEVLLDPYAHETREEFHYLRDRGYLVDAAPDEERQYFRELVNEIHARKQAQFRKQLIFVLTYSCNLDCHYCYQKGLPLAFQTMTLEEVESLFSSLDRAEIPIGKILLYGGEPFQEKTLALVNGILQEADMRGIPVSATTNLTHLDPFLDRVGALDRIQVTLEGPRWMHDQRRFQKGGAPTFDLITRNLDALVSSKVRRISVRVNVDRLNIDSLRELDEFIHAHGWSDVKKMRFYAAEVRNTPHSITQHELDRFVRANCTCIQSDVKTLVKKILEGNLLDVRTVYCDTANQIYAAPGGKLHVCPETPGYIGSYSRGRIEFETDNLHSWQRSFVGRESCLVCPYAFFCGGGCMNMARQSGEAYYGRHCEDFTRMIDENLLLIAKELETQNV